MVKQTKEEFLKDVRDCAGRVEDYTLELAVAMKNSPNDYHLFTLDRELDEISKDGRKHEIAMLQSHLKLAQLCRKKLADVK